MKRISKIQLGLSVLLLIALYYTKGNPNKAESQTKHSTTNVFADTSCYNKTEVFEMYQDDKELWLTNDSLHQPIIETIE